MLFKYPIALRKRGRNSFQKREPKRQHRINEEITFTTLRVVDQEGEMIGVMSKSDALARAQAEGVDLVEISPKADPPVCRIIDYGKMLYQLKKKEQQAKKATKAPEIKGIRLTFRMEDGDIARQRKHAEEFLDDGHAVRVQLMMRGREKAHKDLAFEKLNSFVESLSEVSTLESSPKGAGHQIIAVLKPDKSSKKS